MGGCCEKENSAIEKPGRQKPQRQAINPIGHQRGYRVENDENGNLIATKIKPGDINKVPDRKDGKSLATASMLNP